MSSLVPDITDLASRIRDARRAANLSQVELAERLGVAVRTLQGWEAGTFPQPRHRRALAVFLAEVENVKAA